MPESFSLPQSFWRWHWLGWLGFALVSVLGGLPLHECRRYFDYYVPLCVAAALVCWLLAALCRRAPDWPRWRAGVTLLAGCYALGFACAVSASIVQSLWMGAAAPRHLSWQGALAGGNSEAVSSMVLLLAWCGIYIAVRQWQAVRAREQRLLRLEAQARAAELRALRQELTPHFLFNTLNGISTLVGEGDAPGARRMIALLGDFLRATLERSGDAEIGLDQEIELVRRYLAIEQVRLGERLQVLWRIAPEAARIRVPSLILQPLIENAIRHGITPSPAPGWIEVVGNLSGGTLAIEVANSRGTNLSARSSGLGLRHTRDRLAAHYGGQAACDIHDRDSNRWRVRLNIPVVPAAAEAACAS